MPTETTRLYWAEATALVEGALTGPPPAGKLVVEAWYYWPNRIRRDTDNARKILADALAAVIGVDDHWFLWRDMDWGVDRERPRVDLIVYAANPT